MDEYEPVVGKWPIPLSSVISFNLINCMVNDSYTLWCAQCVRATRKVIFNVSIISVVNVVSSHIILKNKRATFIALCNI